MTVGNSSAVDLSMVNRFFDLAFVRGQVFEIRSIFNSPVGSKVRSWVGCNRQEAAAAVSDFGAVGNVYYTLNPLRPDLSGPASNSDVIQRRWILVDIDSRHGERQATADEVRAAYRVAESVQVDLMARGWPGAVVIDSGNGFHLLYKCDMPNSPLTAQWVAGLLRNLHARHSTDLASVDTSVHNAARIARLPGTYNRKYASGELRLATILFEPDAIDTVPTELVRYAADLPKTEPEKKPKIRLNAGGDGGASSWFLKALRNESERVAKAPPGERHNTLRASARSLAGMIHHGFFTSADVQASLAEASGRCGLDKKESSDVVAWAIQDGLSNPLPWPDKLEKPSKNGKPEKEREKRERQQQPQDDITQTTKTESVFTGQSGEAYDFPLIIRGQDVTPLAVDWLWPDRIPFGFLTLLAGRTGVGKSFVTLDLAARMTRGEEIPEADGECFEEGNVLVIGEDPHEYVLAPRLLEAGADMTRVSFMSWEAMATYSLANSVMLDDAYHEAGKPRLVIIDPPTNFLGAKDEHKNAEVRSVLMHAAIWAMANRVAIVMITHCNKGSKRDLAALDRIIGSVAWATTSRIAHILAPHPDIEGRNLFLPMKTNIGRLPKGISYEIVSTPTLAKVEWKGAVDFDADEAMQGREKKPRGEAAVEWLADRFREKREWPSKDLVDEAREAGISRNALFSSEVQALPIRKNKLTNASGETHWHWVAKEGWPKPRGVT